jgi:hypothetical protein
MRCLYCGSESPTHECSLVRDQLLLESMPIIGSGNYNVTQIAWPERRTRVERKRWLSTVPAKDSFDRDIIDTFIDGATTGGRGWALMTPLSHAEEGVGLGTGRGQMYKKEDDGIFYKVAG